MSLLKSCPGFLFLVFIQNLQIQGECPPSCKGEYSVKKAEKKNLKTIAVLTMSQSKLSIRYL